MDVPPRKLPPKKEVMIALLAESNVFVHLDPRRLGVIVPKWLQTQPELILQLGLNMPIPIHDLEVEDDGVSCTLSFSRAPFWCKLPWSAVFAIVSEKDRRGVVWPDDVPSESQLRGTQEAPPPRPRPKLTALGPNDRLEPEPSDAEEDFEGREETPAPPDAQCADCGTRWPEDQTTCPVCSSTHWSSGSEQPNGVATPRAGHEGASPSSPPTLTAVATPPAFAGRVKAPTRPTLVEGESPNAKKRSAARPRNKTGGRPTAVPDVSPKAGAQLGPAKGKARTRPELVSSPRAVPPPPSDAHKNEPAPSLSVLSSRTEAESVRGERVRGQKKRPDAASSPTSLSPTSLSPTNLSPTSLSPTSLSPTSVSPTSVSPTSLSPTSLSPTSLSPKAPTPNVPGATQDHETQNGDAQSSENGTEGDKKPSKRPLPPYLRVVK